MRTLVDESRAHERRVMCHALGGRGLDIAIEAGVNSIEHGCYLAEDPRHLEKMAERGIFFTPTLLVYEYDHWMRRVFTDGRKLPEDPDALWMGTSVGHWDGNVFVVETSGFNEKTWLDRLGHAHSDQLKVTERFRRVDRDHLELDIRMDDPKALAKPWESTFYYELRPNWELGEITCSGDYLDYTQVERPR
jgi:hypothetical protein